LDFVSAKRLLRERYGLTARSNSSAGYRRTDTTLNKDKTTPPRETRILNLPLLEQGTRRDLYRLSAARDLSVDALEMASERGLLWSFNSGEGRAWLITDRARRNAQARRLDGKPWDWNVKKAWTMRGSCASWPISLPESGPFPAIAVCEGAPDFLAAFNHALVSSVVDCLAPVCLTGAGLSILAGCLPAFAGKRVRIFVHDDAEGRAAAQRWAAVPTDACGEVALPEGAGSNPAFPVSNPDGAGSIPWAAGWIPFGAGRLPHRREARSRAAWDQSRPVRMPIPFGAGSIPFGAGLIPFGRGTRWRCAKNTTFSGGTLPWLQSGIPEVLTGLTRLAGSRDYRITALHTSMCGTPATKSCSSG
jgi:hypothetical protein